MNKILLVTGASSDIGIKLIESIASDYDKIICHYFNNDNKLNDLKARFENKIICIQGDFSSYEGIDSFVKKLKMINCNITHIIHLPAKQSFPAKFHKIDDNDFIDGYTISIISIVKILKYVIPIMSNNNYGKIIFMLSSFTTNTMPKFHAAYITVKYALLGLMRDLSKEYISKGIRVNAISPQMIETKFLSKTPSLVIEQNAKENPFGKNLTIDEIIPTFKFLLSEESDAIAGENVSVSCGI